MRSDTGGPSARRISRSAVAGMNTLRTPDARDHVERLLGVEARRPERDHRRPVGEAGHEDVVEAADPGPVGGCPDPVAGLRIEVVRELEPGQVAREDAVAVERALRRPGRAGGVDEERRRVGRRRGRLERGRRGREQPVEVVVDVDQGAVEAERPHPLQRLPLAEHDPRLRVAEPDVERVGAERRAQRHGDRAELVGGDVRDRGLGALREHDRDPVAGHGAGRGQGVGEPVRALAQLTEADRPGDARGRP